MILFKLRIKNFENSLQDFQFEHVGKGGGAVLAVLYHLRFANTTSTMNDIYYIYILNHHLRSQKDTVAIVYLDVTRPILNY